MNDKQFWKKFIKALEDPHSLQVLFKYCNSQYEKYQKASILTEQLEKETSQVLRSTNYFTQVTLSCSAC